MFDVSEWMKAQARIRWLIDTFDDYYYCYLASERDDEETRWGGKGAYKLFE